MDYDYKSSKMVAVISTAVDAATALNVVGHLGVALGARQGEGILGRASLPDGSGVNHLGISRYPFIVTKTRPSKLRAAILAARADPTLMMIDYPRAMLTTGHDDELADVMAATAEENLDYLGALFYGPAEAVSRITGKFSLWRLDVPASGAPTE